MRGPTGFQRAAGCWGRVRAPLVRVLRALDHRVPALRVGEMDQPRVLVARSRPGVVVVRADLGDETVAEGPGRLAVEWTGRYGRD